MYWVITAVLYEDIERTSLVKVLMGAMDPDGKRGVVKGELYSPQKIAQMIKKGEVVMAMWHDGHQEFALSVQAVPLKNGAYTIETIGSGHPGDKRMADLYDFDMYFFMAGRDPHASEAQKKSSAHYMGIMMREAEKALKTAKDKSSKPLH